MKTIKLVLILVTLTSLFGFGEIGYYQAKAALAQKLMQKAWADSLVEPLKNIRPWPWADIWPELKLKLLGNEFIVLSDASGESLAFGPGLLTTELYPGDMGNSLIAAHRDTHFSNLSNIKLDSEMVVELKDNQQLKFIVDQILVVDSELEKPIIDLEEARLTLVTCYPFDMSVSETSLRYLVSGKLVASN